MRSSKKSYCCNCGLYGHIYKTCSEPITSCGIVLYKHFGNKIKYLLVRRRDSLSYVEFIRGKYNVENHEYIKKLLMGMTKNEKHAILNNSFDDLWVKLWVNTYSKHKKEYNYSEDKFNKLKMINNENEKSILEKLISGMNNLWITPEWGFPKGRRNMYEDDLLCAEREFNEESGLNKKNYIILKHINPVYEIFKGSNNVKYKHIYYIGVCLTDIEVSVNPNNDNQITEIGDIGWYEYHECTKLFRSYNLEKKKVLNKINTLINRLYIKNFDNCTPQVNKNHPPQ